MYIFYFGSWYKVGFEDLWSIDVQKRDRKRYFWKYQYLRVKRERNWKIALNIKVDLSKDRKM